jgi:F-type H+-transporting ATPase subunit delta
VDFHNRFNKAQGQLDVMVTSPVALSDSQATALKDKLGSKYNRTIVLHFKLDPTLMGGMIVDVGGRTYDGSVKTKLDTIKHMVESATA